MSDALSADAHFRAVAEFSGLAALRALTLNYRTVGIARLQDLAVDCARATELHAALTSRGVESFVLATCNRTELYWRGRAPGDDEIVQDSFDRIIGASAGSPVPAIRVTGAAAAEHLFRVCSGLESLVVGEAEILGQVRAALESCTGAGGFLKGVVQAAIRTGRLARAETAIGAGAQSVASAAVQALAAALPLAGSRVLVVGAGSTGMKGARHLRALGVGRLVVANRTVERAEAGAASVGADAVDLESLPAQLALADAIFCATGAPEYVVRAADLARAVAARGGRGLVVVDVSMPPAVEPGEIEGVTRITLQTIEEKVDAERQRRLAEVPRVEAVMARELDRLHVWARRHALRPLMSDLRRKIEAIRQAELARAARELSASHADHAVLDRLSRRLLEQVLAGPLANLESGATPIDPAQAQYLRQLFALGPGVTPCP